MKKILVVSCELDITEKIGELEEIYHIPSSRFVFLIEDFTAAGTLTESERYFIVRDFAVHSEVAAVIENIFLIHQITEVISNDEFSVFVASYVRERLQLAGMKCEEARKYRDKQQMKKVASFHGIPTPEQFSQEDVRRGDVPFPLVLKPRSLAGAVGVTVLQSAAELPAELVRCAEDYRDMDDGQFIIEAYHPGDIFHIDCAIFAGRIVFISVGVYDGKPLDYLHGALLGSVSVPHEDVAAIWQPFTEKLRGAFNFPDGVFHIEAFGGSDKEPALLEIAFRPGGGPITDAVLHAYGIDLRRVHLAAQLGLISELRVSGTDNAYAWLLYPKDHSSSDRKKVRHVTIPRLEKLSTLKAYTLAKIGDMASGAFYCHKDCLGMFVFSGDRELINRDYKQLKTECAFLLGMAE
ncbi:ATP-grasp domain-containing protein [Erwinia pyrifoliae]|uniref:ATP-grasp domain-containing protein n=1 Tax=Erwinia pyrifoliae TaxID=79967 RepID=A0ABY5X8P3_ERWPY|nr:ATP-grasp domain-containing protein [Erwinia pyrifoliae]AUX74262.1 ATP-grasp domain-containing protein [Erwinia pyrifoliae]MCA8875384.1 ATP-grasp domain-containing protein [Erwinia pyrifoliae]UWS29443.1 ATP-grasp domain-containing protein [Erwinia pyrifoliae]UWS33761.1 ATP-grasp domain-containing protein [Erwinia pyrifoliae]UXK12433.1 ATP-grasp domain-containing protein [Erwinia pyrifoliae]